MDTTTSLNAGQHALLGKVLATAVSRAAAALNDTLAQGVMLAAPPPQAGLRHQAATLLAEAGGGTPCVGIKQHFRGRFSGDALLLLSEQDGLELVRAILADTNPLDVMTELEHDALVEVGNILVNAGLSSLALQFKERLLGGVPQIVRGTAVHVCGSRGSDDDGRRGDLMVMQRIDFTIGARSFAGFLAVAMDSLSADVLRRLLSAAAPVPA